MPTIYLGAKRGSYSGEGGVTIDVSEEDYVNCNLFKRYKHKLRTPTGGDIYLYKGSTYITTLLRYYVRLQTGIEYQMSKLESVDVYVNRFDSTNGKLLVVFYFNQSGSKVDNKYYSYSEIDTLIDRGANMPISSLTTYRGVDADKQMLEELIKENDKTNESLTYELDLTGNTRGDNYYSQKVTVSRREKIKGSQHYSVEFYKDIHRPKNLNFQKTFVLYEKNPPMKTDNTYINEIQGQKYTSASVYYSGTSSKPLMLEFDSGTNTTQLRRKMSNTDGLQWFKPFRSSSYLSNDKLIKILKIIESGIQIHVFIEKQERYEENTNGSTTPKNGSSDIQPSSITVLPTELKDNNWRSTGYKYYNHIIEIESIKLPEVSEEEKRHVNIELIPKISSDNITLYDNKGYLKEKLYYTSDKLSYERNLQVYFYEHSSTTGLPDTVPLMIHHDGKFYGPEEVGRYFIGWNKIDNIGSLNNRSNIKRELDKINKKLNKIILTKTDENGCKYGIPETQKSELNSFKTERVNVKSEQISTTNSTVTSAQTCNPITTRSCTDGVYTKYIHNTVNKFQLGAIEYRNKEISVVDENGSQTTNGKPIEVKDGQNQLTVYYLTDDKSCEYPLLIGIGKQTNGQSTEQGNVAEFYRLVSKEPSYKWKKENESGGLSDVTNVKLLELLDKINYEVKKVVQIQLDKRTHYDLNLSKDVGKSDSFNKINNGTIQVDECKCPGYTDLSKLGYKCFRHKLGDSLKNEHNQVGGLAFTLPGAENKGSSNSQIKLKNGQSLSGGTERLYYNKCMGDILVYFYREDPRPLLLCYQNHTYKPKNKEQYFGEWVCVQGVSTCLCSQGTDGSANGQSEKLLGAVTEVVGFLNTVQLQMHPNGTSTEGQACTTGYTAATTTCTTGTTGAPATTQCQPGTDSTTGSNTCTYEVHKYNGQPIQVQVTCCPVNANGSNCYRKLTHKPIGTNGKGATNGSGFRLGDVEYCRNGSGGSRRTGTIKYYQDGSDSTANGSNLSEKNKYAPLVAVHAYFYDQDKTYSDPLLVVLEFKNGVDSSNTEKEYYKLTSSNGKSLTWAKDDAAKTLVAKENGKLTSHLDQIRYCLKQVVRIRLECQTSYPLMGRSGSTSSGKFDKPINGQSSGNGTVQVEVCEVKCDALTEAKYKCYQHKLGDALTGKHDLVAGLAFTLPCTNGTVPGNGTCCVNGGTSGGSNGFVEIPVCVPEGQCDKCQTNGQCEVKCPASQSVQVTCPNGNPVTIPPILYNKCMGDVCVYFYACKNGGTESCAVSTHTESGGNCSPKNNGKNGDTVPLMLRYNGQFYAPCDRDSYFTKWACVSALCTVDKAADCGCSVSGPGGHGADCPKLVTELNKVNEALNRIDLDPEKAKTDNWSSGYGLPEKCYNGLRGCTLDFRVGNQRIKVKHQAVPKQQPCTRNGNGVYTRVIHRTKNGFRIGDIKYCGKDITSEGVNLDLLKNGQTCTPGSSVVGATCPSTSSSTSSDCTITIANGSNGHNGDKNHKTHVNKYSWNTVAVYYSTTDTKKQLPQLIVILKTDEVKNGDQGTVTGSKDSGYGYYVLATRNGSGGVSGGSGYEYKWVEVNGNQEEVKLDEKTDFSLLNSGVILLEQRDRGTGGNYNEVQIGPAVTSAIQNNSLQVSPGNTGQDVNRLKGKSITVTEEPCTDPGTPTHTCPCCCKCLTSTGFKVMSHDLTPLVKLNGPFKEPLCKVPLITGLKLLIPTRNGCGNYRQVTLKDNGSTTGGVRNGATDSSIKYHKNNKNKICVYFYGCDPRPLLVCYNGWAYKPKDKSKYFSEWVKVQGVDKCQCTDHSPPAQCKLLDELVKVADFLNPVDIKRVPKIERSWEYYYVHSFNGRYILMRVTFEPATNSFCFDRYTHEHYGIGCGGEGFRLGDIHYKQNCIKENGSSSNTGANGKCISASDVNNSDTARKTYKSASSVAVYYYKGDTKHKHPLLVALKSHDQGTNGKYKPYFELQKKFDQGQPKLYKKNDNGDGLDLRDTNPNGQLAKKLDSIQFANSKHLRVVLSQRPQPAKYSEGSGNKKCTVKGLENGNGNLDPYRTCKFNLAEDLAKDNEDALLYQVGEKTQYQAQLCDKNGGQPSSPSTLSITVTEVDCQEIHSRGGYRCFCHQLTQTDGINDVGGLVLCVFADKPGVAGSKAVNAECAPCPEQGSTHGTGTGELTLCDGQATTDSSNGQMCTNGKNGQYQKVQLSYTTCKGDLYVFFYGDDPRPLMLCYDGHAYCPRDMESYCREWVRLNNGTTGAKNGQGTPVDCLCQDAGGGGQKPKFNTAPLLEALYRVSVFMNPVKLCLGDKAIKEMKHQKPDQPKPAKPLEHLYTIDKNPPQCIQVRIVPQDLNCYRCYTHKTAREGFRLGVVTYASAVDAGTAQAQGQASCSASTASTSGTTCSAAPGTTTPSEPFCFPYPLDRQLLTVSTYYYMYDSGHEWPLVVELGFRGLASEFFRLCCEGSNGTPGSNGGNGSGGRNGNNGAQGTNGCKSPKGLKWVRMSHTTGSAAKTIPNNSCCPDGSTSGQGSDSNGKNKDCVTCPPSTDNTQSTNNTAQSEDRKRMCADDAEFARRAREIHDAIHSDKTSLSMFLGDRVPMERELTDLVERRAYEVRKGLKINYGDKTEDKLILETASNCWEGWPLDYMVGGGVLGVAGGGSWKIAVAVLGLVVKL